MLPYAAPLRPPTIAVGDLYPEAKGHLPSTAQLANPHEVAAAAGAGMSVPATLPPLNPRAWAQQPAAWLLAMLVVLLVLGSRR